MLGHFDNRIKKKFKYPCVILTDEEKYLYLLESYYQNVEVYGGKMTHVSLNKLPHSLRNRLKINFSSVGSPCSSL